MKELFEEYAGQRVLKLFFDEPHGIDLTCGSNVAKACTEIYQLGDKCREYASCESTGVICTMAGNPEFEECKSCVEACKEMLGGSPKVFDCKANCPNPNKRFFSEVDYCETHSDCVLRDNCCNFCYKDYVNIYHLNTIPSNECPIDACVQDCPEAQ